MERKRKVHWTPAENRLITDAVYAMTVKREIPLPYGWGVFGKLLGEAQNSLLPKDRRRALTAVKAHFKYIEDEILDRVTTPAKTVVSSPVIPPTQKEAIRTSKLELEDLIADSLASLFLDSDLGQRLVGKVTERIKSQALAEAAKALPAVVKEEVAESPTFVQEVVTNKSLPVVVIAGGDKRLFNIIETEFDGILKMKFFEAEALKKASVKQRLGTFDKVLICTDYINHSATHCVKNATEKWEVQGGRQPGPILDKLRKMFKLETSSSAAA